MHFGESAATAQLRESIRTIFERVSPIAHVRAMEDTGEGFSSATLRAIGEADLLRLAAGEDGYDAVHLSVLMQEVGRALVPAPVMSSALVAAALVRAGGSESLRAELLEPALAGEIVLSDGALAFDASTVARPTLTATASGPDAVLDGTIRFVPNAHAASHLVVAAADAGGVSLYAVPAQADGVVRTEQKSINGLRLGRVELGGVRVPAANRIGGAGEAAALLGPVLDRARLAVAAKHTGLAARVLEFSRRHALTRSQFGRRVGSFQVIQHNLVNVFSLQKAAELTLDQAAWSLAEGRDARLQIARAKLQAAKFAYEAVHNSSHLFGGYGFMKAHDTQLYYREAKVLDNAYGDAAAARRQIAELGYLGEYRSRVSGADR